MLFGAVRLGYDMHIQQAAVLTDPSYWVVILNPVLSHDSNTWTPFVSGAPCLQPCSVHSYTTCETENRSSDQGLKLIGPNVGALQHVYFLKKKHIKEII